MRLLMIYVNTQDGIKQDERRQLLTLAGIAPEDQVAILNLFYLNVTLLQGTGQKRGGKGALKGKANEQGYDVSRYVTPLKRTLEELLTAGVSTSDYPFVTPPDSTVSGSGGAGKKGKAGGGAAGGSGDVAATGRRLIVFVLGGLCYSELRSMHELARQHNREIIVGTTAMLTPQAYILGLKQMKQLDAEPPPGGSQPTAVNLV